MGLEVMAYAFYGIMRKKVILLSREILKGYESLANLDIFFYPIFVYLFLSEIVLIYGHCNVYCGLKKKGS